MLEGVIEPLSKIAPAIPTRASASIRLSPQSFEELFLSTYPRLVSLLRRMLGDSGRAEELANEAFLDDLRARSRHMRIAEQASRAISASSQPENGLQVLLRAETQQRVRLALSRIKPEWSQILLLRASGHSYKEIASHLEISLSSVGTLLIRAEAGFEKCYVELFGEKD
jgi:DNA-directed RNA polymerase specialized sigma24 family protein